MKMIMRKDVKVYIAEMPDTSLVLMAIGKYDEGEGGRFCFTGITDTVLVNVSTDEELDSYKGTGMEAINHYRGKIRYIGAPNTNGEIPISRLFMNGGWQ